jgi:TPR repeat protein
MYGMYANGQGVPQDYAQAIEWCRKAAAQDSAGAQLNLGWMYATGQGVPLDYTQAARW